MFCGSHEKPQVRKAGESPKFLAFGIDFAHYLLVNLIFHSPFSPKCQWCISLFTESIPIYLLMIVFKGYSESGTNLLFLPYLLLLLPLISLVDLNKFSLSRLSSLLIQNKNIRLSCV